MNCDCINHLKKRLLKEQPFKGKTITDVRFPDMDFVPTNDSLVAVLNVRLESDVEGRKTPFKSKIMPSYCPICGHRQLSKQQKKEVQ